MLRPFLWLPAIVTKLRNRSIGKAFAHNEYIIFSDNHLKEIWGSAKINLVNLILDMKKLTMSNIYHHHQSHILKIKLSSKICKTSWTSAFFISNTGKLYASGRNLIIIIVNQLTFNGTIRQLENVIDAQSSRNIQLQYYL